MSHWGITVIGLTCVAGLAWLLQPGADASDGQHERLAAKSCRDETVGLSRQQRSQSVRNVMPGVLPCVPTRTDGPAGTLWLRLKVACTGLVDRVELVDAGDWPGSVVGCVQDRLARASFPAHGLVEGDFVDLPIRFNGALTLPLRLASKGGSGGAHWALAGSLGG